MRPSMQFRMPPAWYFKFPPDMDPPAIPPPTEARTFASPFPIPENIYNGVLDYRVPITIGAIYAFTVIIMNKVNRERGNKPWGIATTKSFKTFVLAHNIFLAIFSAFTFIGMIRALAHTWPGREHHLLGKFWPGLRTANGLAGAADALCKMHGPRGFGSGVYYSPAGSIWEGKDTLIKLANGLPDSSDVGRLWNEGLAFWGWWFYLSKFYEVLDTVIILAKGKRSSTLQTYHHTGAMMCMWAGIRFMSPPIWMFAFLNSGIHAMMYTYYTLSALHVKVPQRVKRTLTTMQISQFIIGITFAAMHLFVTYTVPVSTSYTVSQTVESVVSAASSVASSAVAAATTSAGIAAWLKKAAFRAAGEEGLAENVLNDRGQTFGPEGITVENLRKETYYTTGYETIPCIDTSGQAFAIWLNVAYLAPLTGLFVRFFIRSYTRRGAGSRHPTHKRRISKSLQDAAHGTNRELDHLGKSAENAIAGISKELNGNHKKTPNGNSHSNETPRSRRVSATIEKTWERFEKGEETPESKGANKTPSLKKKSSGGHEKFRRMFEDGNAPPRSESPQSVRSRRTSGESAKESHKPYTEEIMEKLEDAAEAAVRKTKQAVGMSQDSVSNASIAEEDEEAVAGVEEEEKPKSLVEDLAESAQEAKDDLKESWADVKKETYGYKSEHDEEAESPKKEPLPSHSSTTETSAPEAKNKAETSSPSGDTPAPLSRQTTGSTSPKKSKIPQPTSSSSKPTGRSRSPTKSRPSSIPRPSSHDPAKTLNNTLPGAGGAHTNGRKPSSSSSSSRKGSTDDDHVDNATSHSTREEGANDALQDPRTSSPVTADSKEGRSSGDGDLRAQSPSTKSGAEPGLSSKDPEVEGKSFAEMVKERDTGGEEGDISID